MTDQPAGAALTPHPCTDLFPPMDEETFDALVADINENGLREPITVDQDNRIVDGLNRYRACIMLDRTPKIERRSFTEAEALTFSVCRNLRRRHLTKAQRAAIAAEIATRKQGGNQAANLPDAVSQAQAAEIMQTSERAVRSAAKVMRHDPQLHQDVKADKISLHAAEQKVNERLTKADARKPKASKPRLRLKAPQDGDDIAAIPGTYALLFAELDALPHYLNDHPLSAQQAGALTVLLTEAIKHIDRTQAHSAQTGNRNAGEDHDQ